MKAKQYIGDTILYIILIFFSVIMIYPFLWTFTASFKGTTQLYNGNILNLMPEPVVLENYVRAWTLVPFYRFLSNSTFLSIIVPIGITFFASMAAYSFAKLNFKGKNIIFMMFLGTMMMPSHVTLIPNYILMRYFGWINKYAALIFPPMFGGMCAFSIFFLKQYFLSIPNELEEAAIIDGCSRFRVYFKIVLPNAKPAIATIIIILFKSSWNSLIWPMIVINDYMKMPIQVGLSYFKAVIDTDWGVLLAGTTISMIPMIIIFLIFQRFFISGVMTSGMGGQ